ncbi:TlyA family rRNA (cytidine-2'-O)-methyltransferase [Candidatus Shapirobacteria bacterium CG08_land_8_20_14_0_20_39_18]|uniref:TlyA family rRNA (Cytidine-2'-O)-methyltransferase n=1 Tax=Candidatus Shapirobacteria bacterium CG08_land_8_20_14_0_20_39_18 TaxID=1974883 RepID=A0A2M6XC55_9BACT|nr:MAG: TlyA family rRNA (cytidine-2'-O)-methyltransferase [Candidatus Shapirobacteria bacterium CG08_land_8_20_14_0_20_39_18]PIY66388.1 MAG: TlyA family rRNA (cytidine-2'-O)-methyltransferase [Candidatus Shapirobacteria bacterium CG_4_10_14_0_8_um_filter_39_15]PJE68312.1 MAG: TlyA family rRNA (cytidine-2'-O)-methyltransferase [Candidatus Shapirobacteria bacterium CG10_big_fil_rev_8_21_14_0_10_38_8]
MESKKFVGRAGKKLEFALNQFSINCQNKICADFGSSIGGFVDCLLQHGAKRVYSVETGYGVLDWNLRNDSRVVVMERINAMHVVLPEKMDLITIDVSWTKQKNIIPNALNNLKPQGLIVCLIKPHYEAEKKLLRKGFLPEVEIGKVLDRVFQEITLLGLQKIGLVESPILGDKGGNKEFLVYLERITQPQL